jgi:hypothetical protein
LILPRSLRLPEGESERLRAWIEKFDLEGMVFNCALQTNQLVKAVLRDFSGALRVYVGAVIRPGRVAVETNAESHGLSIRCGAKDQMQIPRMKAVYDPSRC